MDEKSKLKIGRLMVLLFILFVLVLAEKWEAGRAQYYIDRGNSNFENGNYNEALRNFYFADKLDGDKSTSYLAKVKRGEIFLKFAKYDEAEKELQSALEKDINGYEANAALGDLNFEKKEFDSALGFYNDAFQYSKDNKARENLALKRAKVFIAKGDTELAREILLDFSAKNLEGGSGKDMVYYLGLLTFDKENAANDYLESLKLDDSYKSKIDRIFDFVSELDAKAGSEYSSTLKANLYNSINEPYFAIKNGEKALLANGNYRDAWIVMGKSNFLIENYSAALDNFSKALELDGHNPDTFFWLGSVFRKVGNDKLSEQYFQKFEILK